MACMIRGPKSRAGFKPGPVGPPKDATNVQTKKPNAKCAVPKLFWKNGALVIPSAPKNKMNDPKNSFTNPLNLEPTLFIVEKVPNTCSLSSV